MKKVPKAKKFQNCPNFRMKPLSCQKNHFWLFQSKKRFLKKIDFLRFFWYFLKICKKCKFSSTSTAKTKSRMKKMTGVKNSQNCPNFRMKPLSCKKKSFFTIFEPKTFFEKNRFFAIFSFVGIFFFKQNFLKRLKKIIFFIFGKYGPLAFIRTFKRKKIFKNGSSKLI